jgi:hypothetical protein
MRPRAPWVCRSSTISSTTRRTRQRHPEELGPTENGLFDQAGERVISDFNRSYARAAAMGVTAIASTGDAATANLEKDPSTI